ncbi:MAG: oxidoreductase [Microbacteriaceae bacterium]|nr:oxidoreductase [Microbacteriaceae bacterium]
MSLAPGGRVVVIGGGLAGVSLAEALRAGGHGGPIAIVDREPAFTDRPPLSKAAFVDDAPIEELALLTPDRIAELGIDARHGRNAVALDAAARTVELDDGTVLPADAIVLATGGRARRLAFPGGDSPLVHTLRTYADARAIRAAAAPGARILVVGAGLIGAELASSLRAVGADVVLVDPHPVPLVPAVGGRIAGILHAMHAAHGVDVRVGGIAALEDGEHAGQADAPSRPLASRPGSADGARTPGQEDERPPLRSPGSAPVPAPGRRATAVLNDGGRIEVDAVVLGVGILPGTELAEAAGLEVDDGIVVDARFRTSVAGVYAIGDVARPRAVDGSLPRRDEHWEAARLDGEALAAILLGQEPAPRGAGWWWSDRYGVHVEGVGRMDGDGEIVLREPVDAGGGYPVAFLLAGGRLAGAVSIDEPNAVRAARRLIDQGVPVTATLLADPSSSLRDLLRAAR